MQSLTEDEILDATEKVHHPFYFDDELHLKALVKIVRELEKMWEKKNDNQQNL